MTDFADTNRLIFNYLSGDEQASEELIRLYEAGVFRLALSIVDDPEEANDIAQESLIAALSALNSYQDKGSFKTWLFTITVNLSRSRLRKRNARERLAAILKSIFMVQSQRQSTPEDLALQDEKRSMLWAALNTLKEKHRLPILLRYYHNLSTAEIAEILNINEGTVFSRLHVGRERLRSELEKHQYFGGE